MTNKTTRLLIKLAVIVFAITIAAIIIKRKNFNVEFKFQTFTPQKELTWTK